jgi:conjugative transfer signal peptidase TraF
MTERGAGGLSVIAWLASSVLLVILGWLAGLRLNLTASLPVGLYVTSPSLPVRGALVLVCLPAKVAAFARERGYVPPGEECPNEVAPVGKPVAAIAGDTVAVTPAGIVVNGAPVPNSRALVRDRKGRPLARVRLARYVVEAGTIWIVSSYSRFSFDSRYFGPIEVRQVRATLHPLWTAGSDQ